MKVSEMSNTTLYKYMSLKKFDYFVDTVVNSRLYAAPFKKLNDPMEGFYLKSNKTPTPLTTIIDDERYRVCSLSMNHDNALMWSHYADSYAGVVVGVEIKEQEAYEVEYSINKWVYEPDEQLTHENHLKELTQKFEYWAYEEEKRVIMYEQEHVSVDIKQIFLGNRISKLHRSLVEKLVNAHQSSIEICECQVGHRFRFTL